MSVSVAVGTVKGLFVLRGDARRERFTVEGPLFKGWKVSSLCEAPGGGYFAATASFVYGPTVHRSDDLKRWTQLPAQPRYPEASGFKLNEIWKLVAAGDRVYAGVDEAGLFVTADRGATWNLVEGLTNSKHRGKWFPGFGGLCCHSILTHPSRPDRITIGISAVGVFRSDDGGATWAAKNQGVEIIIPDRDHPEIGWCVHALAMSPTDPDVIYRQDHKGVYVSRDAGDSWVRSEDGLPSGFGFPIAVAADGSVYVAPMESDECRMPPQGRLAVYRSRTGGASWEQKAAGLPDAFHHGVLRGAMAADPHAPAGVYFGTTGGTFHWTNDGGESWRTLRDQLPRVMCVSVFASR